MEAAGVLAWLFVVGAAPLAALSAARVLTDPDPVGVVRDDLRVYQRRLRGSLDGSDDAPLWAEALAVLVPFGLLFRAASHVFAAQAHDLDATLAEQDVSAQNAVAAIRANDHRQADLNGRVLAFLVGLVLWWVYLPGAGPTLAIDASHALSGVVMVYLALNVTVLFADLVLFAGVLHRSTTNTDTDQTHATR